MGRRCRVTIIVGVLALTTGIVAGAQLGSVLKGGAVAVAVDKFGPQINDAINAITGRKKSDSVYATKVVPILSVGDGGYLGAVQVTGSKRILAKVQAVAQVEGRFRAIGGVRLKALVPVSTKTPQRGIRRVDGAGVSAIVDFKL